jgi:polyhydroxyalkanoate synthesis regulator phasin
MIPEEISQLIEDCNVKREVLANHREKINVLQKELLKFAAKSLPKEDLTDLEHYQNQFHIQLINIHDLKHDFKLFLHHLKSAAHLQEGLSDETVSQHQELISHFNTLENLLNDLENNFSDFVKKPHEMGV